MKLTAGERLLVRVPFYLGCLSCAAAIVVVLTMGGSDVTAVGTAIFAATAILCMSFSCVTQLLRRLIEKDSAPSETQQS